MINTVSPLVITDAVHLGKDWLEMAILTLTQLTQWSFYTALLGNHSKEKIGPVGHHLKWESRSRLMGLWSSVRYIISSMKVTSRRCGVISWSSLSLEIEIDGFSSIMSFSWTVQAILRGEDHHTQSRCQVFNASPWVSPHVTLLISNVQAHLHHQKVQKTYTFIITKNTTGIPESWLENPRNSEGHPASTKPQSYTISH